MTDLDPLDVFWADATIHAKINRLAAYWGPKPLDALRPPAWAFGATPEQADELADLVVRGVKTATAGSLADYGAEGEELPTIGQLGIVLDGSERPRALLMTTGVRVVPFSEVDEAHAYAEGEGDRSLATWREVHEAFFAEHAEGGFDPEMPLVLEEFEVLYVAPDPEPAPRS